MRVSSLGASPLMLCAQHVISAWQCLHMLWVKLLTAHQLKTIKKSCASPFICCLLLCPINFDACLSLYFNAVSHVPFTKRSVLAYAAESTHLALDRLCNKPRVIHTALIQPLSGSLSLEVAVL